MIASSMVSYEDLLVSKIEAGETAEISGPPPEDYQPHSICLLRRKPEPEIRADFLRRLLLGLPVAVRGEQTPRAVKFTDLGLCLSGVTITGILNLDDSAGHLKIPRLQFKHCWFDNDILLRRSRLKSLTISKCAFQKLLMSDAKIDGFVDISFARSSEQNPESERCWVILAGSHIKGRINFAGSHFAAPAQRGDEDWVRYSRHPVYALDLRGVQVQGSVQIRPDVVAKGGICLTLAQIEGSVWCSGAELTAIEDAAFSADYATIKGSVYMRPYEHPKAKRTVNQVKEPESELYNFYELGSRHFKATGAVSLFGANIGGSLYMSGAELITFKPLKLPTDETRVVLDACNAVIGGNCHLRCFRPYLPDSSIVRFKAEGVISLESARVNKDLLFSGAHVEEIQASNIEIGGNCNMSVHKPCEANHVYAFRASKAVYLKGASIKGTLNMNGAKIGVFPHFTSDGHTEDIGMDFFSCKPLTQSVGSLTETDQPPTDVGIFASSLTVGGNCELSTTEFLVDKTRENISVSRFQCCGQVVMREANLKNSFRMDGAMILGPKHGAAVDLSGAIVGGQVTFKVWSSDGVSMDGKESIAFELVAGRRGVRLTGARVGEKLIMNGATLSTRGVALDASNIQVGGKTSLSKYKDARFLAHGEIRFTSSSLNLGLEIDGATLKSPLSDIDDVISRPSLDVSLAKVKVVRLSDLELSNDTLLKGAEVEGDIYIKDATVCSQLNFEHARVGTSVWLRNVDFQADLNDTKRTKGSLDQHIIRSSEVVYLSMRAVRIAGELDVDQITCRSGDENDHITVDLRSAHVDELNDKGGAGWGRSARFWLEGFQYRRLAEAALPDHKWTFKEFSNRLIDPSYLPNLAAEKCESCGVWENRLRWLQAQYYDGYKPNKREFQPAAYEQVVSSWNSIGSYPEARRINSAKLSDGHFHRATLVKVAWSLFRVCFDYGLSAQRAITTFSLCIAFGTVAVCIANGNISPWPGFRPALVASERLPSSLSLDRTGDKAKFEYSRDVCEKRIEPLLYALDVFVPVLDLKQQTACSISPERHSWRIAQALYALMGWILTPLMFLTVTGILRRHLER